jgi:hypothetical protein
MRSRRSLIFRLTLSLVLGAITTWLVAWGLATAVWAQKLRAPEFHPWWEFALRYPYRIELWRSVERFQTKERWQRTWIDREQSNPLWTKPEPAGSIMTGPRTRRDQVATAFARTGLASLVGESKAVEIERTMDGWPWRCQSRVFVRDGIGAKPVGHWMLSIDTSKSANPTYAVRSPIELSYMPIWSGLLLDTGFYGVLWAVPLFGLPLLRARRRRRKGRCPRCGYDLKAAFEHGCPECGWLKRG